MLHNKVQCQLVRNTEDDVFLLVIIGACAICQHDYPACFYPILLGTSSSEASSRHVLFLDVKVHIDASVMAMR